MAPNEEFYFMSQIAFLIYPRRARYLQLRDVAWAREQMARLTTVRRPRVYRAARAIIRRLGRTEERRGFELSFRRSWPVLEARLNAARLLLEALDAGREGIGWRDVVVAAQEASNLMRTFERLVEKREKAMSNVINFRHAKLMRQRR
jgi:hypothetical protein